MPAPKTMEDGVGGIYPEDLTLNDTSLEDCVQFSGMELRYIGNSLEMEVFDKRKDFPFSVIR